MSKHIHGKSNNVNITCALAVSEKGTFDTVGSREQTHFRVGDSAAAVVVWMQGNNKVFAAVHVLAHIFNLTCVNVRHTFLNGNRKVYDYLVVGSRLPYIYNSVAYFKSKFGFRTCKAFGTVLKAEISLCFFPVLFTELCSENSNVNNFLLGLFEHLLTLSHGSAVVKVYHSVFTAFESFKCFGYDVFAALGKYLNCNVVGDKVLFDQRAAECVFCFACGGKAYFDLLEAYLNKVLPEFKLFFKGHGNNESLISVAEIHGAPYRSFGGAVVFYPVIAWFRGHKVAFLIAVVIFHDKSFLSFLRKRLK